MTNFNKSPAQNFTKILPVGAELIRGQMDGQAGRRDDANR
jgi:hypothetical protein